MFCSWLGSESTPLIIIMYLVLIYLILIEEFVTFPNTHATHTDILVHARISRNVFSPVKAFSFAHLLEIHKRIMLDNCTTELYSKVHGNVDDRFYYCISRHGRRTMRVSTNFKPEVVYPLLGAKVTCMHNFPKLFI